MSGDGLLGQGGDAPRKSGMAAVAGDDFDLAAAMGGPRGLAEGVLPGFLFLLVLTITDNLTWALVSALSVSFIALASRVITRTTVVPGIVGVLGVVINIYISRRTGEARDFFVSGLWINLGYGLVFAMSCLPIFGKRAFPLLGVVLSPFTGEKLAWRDDPPRLRAYVLATWLWAAMFAARLAVQTPLYLADEVGWLGSARLVMSTPLWLLCAWGSFLILKGVPKTVPPDEAEEPPHGEHPATN